MNCASCEARLDHCHGTLVQHADGGAECTDGGCTGPDPVRHALLLDCASVDGGCACLLVEYESELLRAS
ncbi:hypothetical protein B0I33_109131 [Prauserella shujinwangii]|uniref:Uncharacterized protein n=1 Tax=Prauserella shujinwangii TaxID=1453103 RepID=A0A2T0LQ43_9PSEU|nr:hypothetical protein [Prauserella shujinwangii]PRX45468.1 hypothetical protein B0I33_109131 [Prauserella shujinwangii]